MYPEKTNMKTKRGSRSAKALLEAETAPIQRTGWVKAVLTTGISSVVALSFILFAAGSVVAITSVAVPEITASGTDTTVPHSVRITRAPAVLGVSTINAAAINDAALEATDPVGAIYAKPASFDSTAGRWDYNFSYKISGGSGPATLSIGTYVVASNIAATGTVETGAILKPNHTYRVFLWVQDLGGNKQIVAHIVIKTGKGSAKLPLPCLQTQIGTSAVSTITVPCAKTGEGDNKNGTSTLPHFPPLRPVSSSTPTGTPPIR